LGLEKPNLGLDPGETFFPNSVSDLDSAETFQITRNLGLDIDKNVCLLDSQPCFSCILEHLHGCRRENVFLANLDFKPYNLFSLFGLKPRCALRCSDFDAIKRFFLDDEFRAQELLH
jgi:hypothetical protein